MTVKKNNRPIFFLTVLLFVFSLPTSAFSVQKKNILHVRFETAKVKPSINDIVLKVFYKLEAPKPISFRGFDCRFIYQKDKIQPATTFFQGTACQNADNAHGTFVPPEEYRVQVLSSTMLDTANPVLFEIRYTVKGISDSVLIIPTLFTPVDDDGMRIDTVVIDNSPGRDQISWYPFGLMFADTSKPPPPPKKMSITLSIDSADIQSDSLKVLSLNVSSLDSANLKSGIFEFDADTSAFDSVAVVKGALLSKANFSVARDSIHITANFSSIDSFAGSGELLKIVLRGKKRTDTVCTGILHPKLSVLNGDNLVASVAYKFQDVCVLGKQKIVKGVVGSAESKDQIVGIYPNPASSFIDFHTPSGQNVKKHLEVFDALGRKIFDAAFDADLRWETASVPTGIYTATVTNFSALQNDVPAETRKFLIIH